MRKNNFLIINETIDLKCEAIEVDPIIIMEMQERLNPRPFVDIYAEGYQARQASELERIMRERWGGFMIKELILNEIRKSKSEYITYGDGDLGLPIKRLDAIADIESMDDEMIGEGAYWCECNSQGDI
jgi:hypothetical protein